MPVVSGHVELAKLMCQHTVKLAPAVSCKVEECGLAVGEVVGHGTVKSVLRMNNTIVIFWDCVDKVNLIVEQGVIPDTFYPCSLAG